MGGGRAGRGMGKGGRGGGKAAGRGYMQREQCARPSFQGWGWVGAREGWDLVRARPSVSCEQSRRLSSLSSEHSPSWGTAGHACLSSNPGYGPPHRAAHRHAVERRGGVRPELRITLRCVLLRRCGATSRLKKHTRPKPPEARLPLPLTPRMRFKIDCRRQPPTSGAALRAASAFSSTRCAPCCWAAAGAAARAWRRQASAWARSMASRPESVVLDGF